MQRIQCSCGRIMHFDADVCPYCRARTHFAKYTLKLPPKRKSDEEIFEYVTLNFPNANFETIKIWENIAESLSVRGCYWKYDWNIINYCIDMDRPNSSVQHFGINKSVIDNISLKQLVDFLKFLGKENEMGIIVICG